MAEPIGVMLCGHGSRDPRAVSEFAQLASRLSSRFPLWPVDYGYLEFARPVIRDGLDRLLAQGVRHVLAVPGMLFAAGHAKNDIPSVLNTYQAGHSGVRIEYGRELGLDPRMIQAAAARIREALGGPAITCRCMTRCWSSSAAARPIPTRIPTLPRSPACCGRASASAGRRRLIPA
jgi:sirohydrochlorin cobaltochelatase